MKKLIKKRVVTIVAVIIALATFAFTMDKKNNLAEYFYYKVDANGFIIDLLGNNESNVGAECLTGLLYNCAIAIHEDDVDLNTERPNIENISEVEQLSKPAMEYKRNIP